MRKCSLIFVLLCAIIAQHCTAQSGEIINKKEQKRIQDEGEFYYEEENYSKAMEYFKQLEEVNPNDLYIKLVLGICYSHITDQKPKAISYLEEIRNQKPDFNLVNLYLGRAYFVNQKFDKAKETLKLFLQDEDVEDDLAITARRLLEYCENAEELVADSIDVLIGNVGNVVNSEHREYVPLITPDESQLIFTYRGPKSLGGTDKKGEYFEDIYVSYKSPDDWLYEEDVWLEPVAVDSLNTENDDACIAISIDGQKLFLYKYEKKNGGDIYISQLDGKIWSEPYPLEGGINSEYWEGSVAISSDETEIYFASDRPGGFGGRDLYKAEKQEDGTWGNIQNLGPNINTPYNDDSPYIQIDKQTLFYSSEGHNTMGGYDIFFSRRNRDDSWTLPKNLGYPINSVEDDKYFVVNASGRKGYYSSAGLNSIGDHDLFYVELDPEKLGIKSIAALIVGTVYANDEPTKSVLTITNKTLGITAGVFESNSETGNYGIALAPGYEYSISFDKDSFPAHTDEIDLSDLNEYIEVSNNVHLYTDQFMADNNITPDSAKLQAAATLALANVGKEETDKKPIAAAVVPVKKDDKKPIVDTDVPVPVKEEDKEPIVTAEVPVPVKEEDKEPIVAATDPVPEKKDDPCDSEFVDLSAFVGKDLNDIAVYNEFLKVIGNYCADQLVFKVQIGAYRFPENYKYEFLSSFGEADVVDYPDGITRFTMGEFVTLKQADDLRQEIIVAGQKDAWVIPFFDGKRIFMEELIKVNFYNRSIN